MWGRKVLLECRRRSKTIYCWSFEFGLQVGSWNGGRWLQDKRIFRTEDHFGKVGCGGGWLQKSWMWRRLTLRKLDMAEAPGWTLGIVNFSREVLGSWTCIIILIRVKFWPLQMPSASPLVGVCGREVEEEKILGVDALKLIMRFAVNLFGSLWIF